MDGTLSLPVLLVGTAGTAAGLAGGLRKLDPEHVPRVAMLSAAFFVVSLVHVPFFGVSTHLVLTGLMGLVLGWAVFPALLVALFLQFQFWGQGGLTTLGVNALTMGLPAVLCGYLFRPLIRCRPGRAAFLWAGLAGAVSAAASAVLVALALAASGTDYRTTAVLVLGCQLAVVPVEGLVTGAVVSFLIQVRPEVFGAVAASSRAFGSGSPGEAAVTPVGDGP